MITHDYFKFQSFNKKLMNLQTFKSKFDPVLKNILDEKINQTKDFLDDCRLNKFIDYISDFVFSGGKRLRPYWLFLAYKLFKWKDDKETTRFSAIFEIWHSMLLIHDDIIDKAEKRHNIKSFHKYLESVLPKIDNALHIAMWQTIVVWDLMLGWVYELLYRDFKFERNSLDEARKNIHTMINEVILWQMIDIDTMTWSQITEETLYKKNLYKTARYTFARPMLIWSILAWAPKKDSDLIFKIWEILWLAFQIRDDLNDILAQDKDKTMFSDIQEWQQTYFTVYVMKNGNNKQKKNLKDCMWKTLDKNQIKTLQEIFDETWAINYWKKMIKKYCDEAQKSLEELINCDKKYVKNLKELIDFITS